MHKQLCLILLIGSLFISIQATNNTSNTPINTPSNPPNIQYYPIQITNYLYLLIISLLLFNMIIGLFLTTVLIYNCYTTCKYVDIY
jgi:hypothetical protein